MTDTERIEFLKYWIDYFKNCMKLADDKLAELTRTEKSKKENFALICRLRKDYVDSEIQYSTHRYILEQLFDERG